jgi:hypothetical protein
MKFGTGEYGPEMSNFLLPENQTDLLRKYCGLENFTKKKKKVFQNSVNISHIRID